MTFKTLSILAASMILAGCGVTDMFTAKSEKPLKGERISILELQKSLQPEQELRASGELVVPAPWTNQYWPQAGGYPNHSMQHAALGPAPLKRAWTARIGRGSFDELPLTAQPIVVDGVIYTLDTASVISAIEAGEGDVLWRTNVRNLEEDDPVIGGGLAYANGILYATNGYAEVVAVAPDKGDILWRAKLPSAVRAAPTVIEGRIFVTTLDNRLVTLNADDGTILWEHAGLAESAGLVGAASPAANRDIVVPAFSSGELSALRVENGSVAWTDNLSGLRRTGGLSGLSDIRALPVIDKGLVIAISFNGRLVAIDERTGRRIWQKEMSGSETPWVAGNHVFVLSEDNELTALSRDDGAIYWVIELPRYQKPESKSVPIRWTGPILAGGRLIVASSAQTMLEIDPVTGKTLGSTKLPSPVILPPVVAGGRVYLLGENGVLSAYE